MTVTHSFPKLNSDRHARTGAELADTPLYAQLVGEDGALDWFVAEYDPESDVAFGWIHDGRSARSRWDDFKLTPLLDAKDDVDVAVWPASETQAEVEEWMGLGDNSDEG